MLKGIWHGNETRKHLKKIKQVLFVEMVCLPLNVWVFITHIQGCLDLVIAFNVLKNKVLKKSLTLIDHCSLLQPWIYRSLLYRRIDILSWQSLSLASPVSSLVLEITVILWLFYNIFVWYNDRVNEQEGHWKHYHCLWPSETQAMPPLQIFESSTRIGRSAHLIRSDFGPNCRWTR